MKSNKSNIVSEDLKTVQDRMIDSLSRLTAYNKSDSPAFSQTGSLLLSIVQFKEIHGNNNPVDYLSLLLKNPVQILNDKSLTSEDWDGAPLELVKECRKNWKKYKDLLLATK